MDGEKVKNTSQLSNTKQRKAIIAKLKASRHAKRRQDGADCSDDEESDNSSNKIKKYTIPHKKDRKDLKGLFTDLPLRSHEYMHALYPTIKSSFLYPHSSRQILINKAELVNNKQLLREFMEKKKDMKDKNRSEKELAENLAYLHVSNKDEVANICENGLVIGNSTLVSLGKPSMGVYLCKHADVTTPSPMKSKDTGFIIAFKMIKGKTKLVTECHSPITTQEPTPLYDSHTTKFSVQSNKGNHTKAYNALQYYLYEYGDLDLVGRPRHAFPYAVLQYTCGYIDKKILHRDRDALSMETTSRDRDASKRAVSVLKISQTFSLWKGKLLVNDGLFCDVQMKTDVDTAINPAFIDKSLNVKIFISNENFSKMLPSVLRTSVKKHNIQSRGRNYNTFILTPFDDSGVGKFRQLIAYLVQNNAVGVVPLHVTSCMYLMARSKLTIDELGLSAPLREDKKPSTHFLHVLIVTPKRLSSKVNEQRVYNQINVRKRRDLTTETRIPDELDQKLRAMNIESVAAVGSMQPEQIDKLVALLKHKKRLQISDRLIINHYKKEGNLLPSKPDFNRFVGKIGRLWQTTCQARLDYYRPKEGPDKTSNEFGQKSILKGSIQWKTAPEQRRSSSQASSLFDRDTAVFSDEDVSPGSGGTATIASGSSENTPKSSAKRKLSMEPVADDSIPPVKLSRPSFKAVEKILFTNDLSGLILHPDFRFSEGFEKSHKVMKGPGFTDELNIERESQISVKYTQVSPFDTSKDCPYAYDGDLVVKSMLRAIHGAWREDPSSSHQDKEKVCWMRNVIHKKQTSSPDPRQAVLNSKFRALADGQSSSVQKDCSPSGIGGSSADSGFASSSTTTTPIEGLPHATPSSSIQDLASLLASAIQDKPSSDETSFAGKSDVDLLAATQEILQVLAKTVSESGREIPDDLKEILNDLTSEEKVDDKNSVDEKESISSKYVSPAAGSLAPSDVVSPSPAITSKETGPAQQEASSDTSKFSQVQGHPQDPRLNRTGQQTQRLCLPNYSFPPPEKATRLLPKDEEAAQEPLTLDPVKTNKPSQGVSKINESPRNPTNLSKNGIPRNTSIVQEKSMAVIMTRQSYPGVIKKITDPRKTTQSANQTTNHMSSGNATPIKRKAEDLKEKAGKNVKTFINDLLAALEKSGLIPNSPQVQHSQETPIPKSTGVLKGAVGPQIGQQRLAGTILCRSSGQVVRSFGDKEFATSITNNDSESLHASKILSHRVRAIFPDEPITFYKPFSINSPSENFTISLSNNLFGADALCSIADTSYTTAKVGTLTKVSVASNETNTTILNTVSKNADTEDSSQNVFHPVFSPTSTILPTSVVIDHTLPPSEPIPVSLSPATSIQSSSSSPSVSTASSSSPTTISEPMGDLEAISVASTSHPTLTTSYIQIVRAKHKKAKQHRMRTLKPKIKSSEGILSPAKGNKSPVAALSNAKNSLDSKLTSDVNKTHGTDVCKAPVTASSVHSDVALKPDIEKEENKSELSTSQDEKSLRRGEEISSLPANVDPTSSSSTSTEVNERSPVSASEADQAIASSQSTTPVTVESLLPSGDLYSEINNILSHVRDAQQGSTPSDELSSRLLELAMQLRGGKGAPAPSSTPNQDGVTTAVSQDAITTTTVDNVLVSQSPSLAPTEEVVPSCIKVTSDVTHSVTVSQSPSLAPTEEILPSDVKVTSDVILSVTAEVPPSSDVSSVVSYSEPKGSDNTAVYSIVPSDIGDKDKVSVTMLEEPAPQTQDVEKPVTGLDIVPPSDPGNIVEEDNDLLNEVNISERPSVDVEDEDRFTSTPTLDDTYSGIDEAVRNSFVKTYKVLKPLSHLLRPEIDLSDKLGSSVLNADGGERESERDNGKSIKSPEAAAFKSNDLPRSSSSDSSHPTSCSVYTTVPSQVSNQAIEPTVTSSPVVCNTSTVAPQLSVNEAQASSVTHPALPTSSQYGSLPDKDSANHHNSTVGHKSQKMVALVKPQPANPACPSFYVFNPRGNAACDQIESYLLITQGIPFQMQHVADSIASLACEGADGDDELIQVTKEILDKSLNGQDLWIVIRKDDMELMPALPYLSMFKCARRMVQFVQADSAEDVSARRYTNILDGEFGILMPVSLGVILKNNAIFVQLIHWMGRVHQKTKQVVWRLALYQHIKRQLLLFSKQKDAGYIQKSQVQRLVDAIEKHSDVITSISAKDDNTTHVSTSEVFDSAIDLQLRFISTTRHIIALTEGDQALNKWKTHKRAGIAVATVHQFVRAVMEDKGEKADTGKSNPYSLLTKLYRVEK